MIDWTDTTRKDRFAYEMVDPFDLDATRGWLSNVTGGTMTQGYYVENRVSASLTAIDSGYIDNSLIRIHHYVDEWGFHEEMGTFFVSKVQPALQSGIHVEKFDLQGMLQRPSEDLFTYHYAYSNKYALDILAELFDMTRTPYRISSGCTNRKFLKAKVYEVGENIRSTMFDIANEMGARLEVDTHGYVVVEPYILPSQLTPEYTFAYNDGTIAGAITLEDPKFTRANRAIVLFSSGDTEIFAYADVEPSTGISADKTGRVVAQMYSVSELENKTKAGALELARSYVSDNDEYSRVWSFDSIYTPQRGGTAITLKLPEYTVVCMLKSRDINLGPGMLCKNNYKEIQNG